MRLTPRLYQETIAATATSKNTLVVLPTGMGKTAIAAMIAEHRLKLYPDSTILFLAPTRPLVQQHRSTFEELLDLEEQDYALFTGQVRPEKRREQWEQAKIVFSTPQGLENDLISRRINLENVSLIIFDEAHRAVGDYAYTYIAEVYEEQAVHERILALTASPGTDEETVKQVCENLRIEALEVRSNDDPDLQPYTQNLDITWENITLTPTVQAIRKNLQQAYDHKLGEAQLLGAITVDTAQLNKTRLLKLQAMMHARTATGEKNYETLKTISLLAEALKLQHALELIETQCVAALTSYLRSLQKQARTSKTKAVQNLVADQHFRVSLQEAENLLAAGEEHPKLLALRRIVAKTLMEETTKIIIFTQYRDTAVAIKDALHDICSSEIFVGQAKKKSTGLSQKEQKAMIEDFRNGEFTTLIATSVAEEGLDIPSVDKVIFYEPIPSAIRTVQRRGRTARQASGSVTVLVSKGTRDEGYRWSAHHKEKRMYRVLDKVKRSFTPGARKKQATLSDYKEIYHFTVDHREKGSAVMKTLLAQKAELTLEQLPIGDYKITDEVIVEYKTVKDFVDSVIDGRLLSQTRELSTIYKPIIIIEGTEDLYAQRRISPNALRGMLAAITLNYHIPILRTTGPQDTAGMLLALARRVQRKKDKHHTKHAEKPWHLPEQQEYLIASLPGIGTGLAKPLLKHFGTPRKVLRATKDDLQDVEKIGEKKADAISELLDTPYD